MLFRSTAADVVAVLGALGALITAIAGLVRARAIARALAQDRDAARAELERLQSDLRTFEQRAEESGLFARPSVPRHD